MFCCLCLDQKIIAQFCVARPGMINYINCYLFCPNSIWTHVHTFDVSIHLCTTIIVNTFFSGQIMYTWPAAFKSVRAPANLHHYCLLSFHFSLLIFIPILVFFTSAQCQITLCLILQWCGQCLVNGQAVFTTFIIKTHCAQPKTSHLDCKRGWHCSWGPCSQQSPGIYWSPH